jgi:hypothetical protein
MKKINNPKLYNYKINFYNIIIYMSQDYYQYQYIKYKNKYLELQKNQNGGKTNNNSNNKLDNKLDNKFDEITRFIYNSNKEQIQKELFNLMKYDKICVEIIGEGHFGRTYVPTINKTITYVVGKNKLELPIIIKESKQLHNNEAYDALDIIDNILYISGNNSMTMETLNLIYIRKLWKKTVNLPLIFSYGTCANSSLVDKIVSLKYGLDKPITIDLTGKIYNLRQLWFNHNDKKEIFTNNIATLKDLFIYIYYNKQANNTVILPNKEVCDISELYDYLSISYLATHQLLAENNIYPSDMHSSNIFIHWLNSNSYFGDTNIKNIKEIIYKVYNKYYKIKTFGFVIILGDVGTFNIKVKDDVIIMGQFFDIKNNHKLIKYQLESTYTNMDFIQWNIGLLTLIEFENTIAYKILKSFPYNTLPFNDYILYGADISYLDKLKSTVELLAFFDSKYGIKKYRASDKNILIDCKKYDIFGL